jgi:acetylornithine/LysW-gamma-L-lysine aminotransferase
VQLRGRVRPYLTALQGRGVLALSAGTSVLRLLPPLVIDDAEIDRVAAAVIDVLGTPV